MSKGSEWRRWDLHVHTKSSYDYKYDGEDADEKLVAAWKENNIEVVAITDHFFIDAKRIKRLRELSPQTTIFPGVELRTDKGASNIHVILIFSDKKDLKTLQQDFESIMIRSKAKNEGDNERIYWDYNDIIEFAKSQDAIISIHAGSKANGVDDAIRNTTLVGMAIKTEYKESVDIYEVGNKKSLDGYKEQVFPVIGEKPLIICSDNHNPLEYYFKEKLWVKADKNFDGLKQAIYHPSERFYVGDEPTKKIHERVNGTNIIDRINIVKKIEAKNSQTWFNVDLPLNSSLVTIIGNKGSGKSAISDIIGLSANSGNVTEELCSFLNKTRFNKKPKSYANDYKSSLTWRDGHVDNRTSLEISMKEGASKVQYLPQKYIENVCSNLDESFQDEVNKLLYSYLDATNKLGTDNFEEFVEKKTMTIKVQIAEYKEQIKNINLRIIALEDKKTTSYLKEKTQKKDELVSELERLELTTPLEVTPPTTEDSLIVNRRVDELNHEIQSLEHQINEVNEVIKTEKEKIHGMKLILVKAIAEIDRMNYLNNDIKEICDKFKIATNLFLVKVEFPQQKLESFIEEIELNIQLLEKKVDINESMSLVNKKEKLMNKRADLLEGSDHENRSYQIYLKEKEKWDLEIQNYNQSILGIEEEINYITNNLSADYESILKERAQLSEKIYNKKMEIIKMYEEIYSPIEKELKPILEGLDNGISFIAKLSIDTVKEKLLSYINKQVTSKFQGLQQADKNMSELLSYIEVDDFQSISDFLTKVFDDIVLDEDYDKLNKVIKDRKEFYNYLYGLDYIKVEYNLTLEGKDLTQLSPGERGLVLLIFYLVLSRDKNPIIIDQPEDNLDNQSIFSQLVPCILKAKESRQVIIVTHNPNIAVACDSEQVILAEINKKKEKITYISGSIEDKEINKSLLNILEGTLPAFDLRKTKYILNEI